MKLDWSKTFSVVNWSILSNVLVVQDKHGSFHLIIMIHCDQLAPRLLNHPFQVPLRRRGIFGRLLACSLARSLRRYALIKTHVGLTRRP